MVKTLTHVKGFCSILDVKHWDNKPQIGTYKFDLIHNLTENGLKHASGPVNAKHPIRYINTMLYPIIFNSNTIELTMHTSCYLGLRLTLC